MTEGDATYESGSILACLPKVNPLGKTTHKKRESR